MIFKAARNTLKKQKNFIVFLILLIIFTINVVTISFYFLSKKEWNNKITNYITRNQSIIEEKIERNIINYFNKNVLRYSPVNSFSIFYDKDTTDREFLNKIRIAILDSIRMEEDIHDIILYRVDDNTVVSGLKSGYSMESLAYDFDDIKGILSLGNPPHSKFYQTLDKKITYIFPIYNQNRFYEGAYRGFATLYLRNPDIFFDCNVKSFHSKGTLTILYGNTILHTEGSNTLSDEIIFDMVNTGEEGTMIKKHVHSLNYTYLYKTSKEHNLTFLYYVPTPNFFGSLTGHTNYALLYGLTLFLIGVFSGFLYITIRLLNKNVTEQKLVIAEYANELMKASNPTSVDLVIDKYLHLDSNFSNFSAILIEPNPSYLMPLSQKQKNFTVEELKETAKNYFKTKQIPCVVSSLLEGYVSCIINYDNTIDIPETTKELSKEFKKYSKCPFNIFYSNGCQSSQEASQDYTKLIRFIKYSFIYGYNKIFSLSKLEEMDRDTTTIDSKVTEIITEFLKESSCERLSIYLRTTLSQIKEKEYSYTQTIEFFHTVLLTVKNFFHEKSVDYPFKNMPLSEQLAQFKDLDECISFIEKSMNTYLDGLLLNQTPTNKRYMENILQYIDENIETATLSAVAEEFHITSAHLSRMFKDNYGSNFSDYVSEKKLLRAAHILRETPDINSTQLAARLGYNTPSYFSSKFKERFGVTPGTYKKEYMNSKG